MRGPLGLLPAVVFVLLVAAGRVLVVPLARDVVAGLAGERRLGAYFGVLSSLSGCAAVVGSTATGVLLDVTPATGAGAALPRTLTAAVPLVSFAVLPVLPRHDGLRSRPARS